MKKYSKDKQLLETSQNMTQKKKEQSTSKNLLLLPLSLSTEEICRQVKLFLKNENKQGSIIPKVKKKSEKSENTNLRFFQIIGYPRVRKRQG